MEEEKSRLNILFQKGNEFEIKIITFLRNKYPNHIIKIVTKYVQVDDVYKTSQAMNEGVPIIEQAALYNFKNKNLI